MGEEVKKAPEISNIADETFILPTEEEIYKEILKKPIFVDPA